MSEQHATLEVIAPTIDEAVSKGLRDLGLPLESVEVEILDEGNRGILGIGSRQARVRLTVKAPPERSEAAPRPAPERSAPSRPPVPMVQEMEPDSPEEAPELMEEQAAPRTVAAVDLTDDEENLLAIARETVSELLEKMRINAEVSASFGESDDPRGRPPVKVDIRGKDLSILIGRKSATLDALQYVSRLIVSKEMGHSVLLVVDVEGYRARRERQLRRLALQIADQAVKTGRRQTLEPMPPNERRIIHIELRNDDRVTTESIGEDPRRKVTIIPAEE